jgi:DNA repair exonuclease SbcCD nuclease subunit
MRFAHLSDTHLGYRQYNLDTREEDFYIAFQECIDKIISERCDFVIHSGDLFDDPRPHIRAMVEVRNALEKLDDHGIKFFTVAGNHDILMRRRAMIPHAIYRKIEVLTPQSPTREFDGILIAGMPYHSKIYINTLKEKILDLAKKAEDYEKSILVLHQGIDKYFGLDYELKIADLPSGFDYYALGHIHKRIEDQIGEGKLVYPGSIEMWRIDELPDYEKNGKGFVIVETEDFTTKKINLKNTRSFLRFDINTDFDLEEIVRKINEDKKPVLYITVESDAHDYQKIYQKLIRRLNNRVLYLDIKRKAPSEEVPSTVSGTVDIKALMYDAMKEYLDEEKEFAYRLFNLLSSGDLEAASHLTEEFYQNWNPGRRQTSKEPEATGMEKTSIQSSLEAFE